MLKAFEHGEMLYIFFQISLGALEGVKWKEGRLETGRFSCEEGKGWISGKGKRGKSEKTHVGQNRILNHSQFVIGCGVTPRVDDV